MISYSKALQVINKTKLKILNQKILINESLNRISAENVYSKTIYPSANNTAFDGFAIKTSETRNLSRKKSKKFKILKTIAAGDNPVIKNYQKNSTVEIMTGGIVPKYYDTIIPIEKIKFYPSKNKPTHIIVEDILSKHKHVRFAGTDYKMKDLIIKKGEMIEPKHIMAFATLGLKHILVKKKPKIIFISTGDELVDYKKNKKINPWQLRNSNNHYLISLKNYIPCKIIDGGIIKDSQPKKLKEKIKTISKSDIDIVLTSGAVSAGKFDFVPNIVRDSGIKTCFKNVAIRPGKPIMFGKFKKKNKVFFGLPGNPISSAACFRFFVYPLIRNSLGMKKELKFKTRLKSKFEKKKKFTRFLKGISNIDKNGKIELKILKGQESFKIKSFVSANVWAIFKSGQEKFKKNDLIDCIMLNP